MTRQEFIEAVKASHLKEFGLDKPTHKYIRFVEGSSASLVRPRPEDQTPQTPFIYRV